MKFTKIFSWILISIPLLWLTGLHVTDLVRVILGVFLIGLFFPKFRKALLEFYSLSKLQSRLLLVFLILYPFVMCAQHLIRVFNGTQGINFAYRTQVIDNFVNRGMMYSTILQSDYSPQNWLAHHFNPILIIPALFGFIGYKAYISQIICMFLIIILVSVVTYKIMKLRGYSKNVIYLPIVFFFSIYSVRAPLTFGIEDEYFAMPFIALAYYFLFKNRFTLSCLFVLMTFSVKESFFLFGISWGIMGIILYTKELFGLKKKDVYLSIGFIFLGSVCFYVYTFGHEILSGKPYEHFHKAVDITAFFQSEILLDKFYNFVLLFLPFLFFSFFQRKSLLLIIPAAPFILMMFYSNFMFSATDYYAVIPSFIIFISCVYYLPEKNKNFLNFIRPGIFVAMFSIAYLYGTWKPVKMIIQADSSSFASYNDLEEVNNKYINENDRVLVSLSLAPISTMIKNLSVIVDQSRISNRDFEYVIIKKDNAVELKDDLEKFTIPFDTTGHNSNILLFKRKY